MLPFVVETNWTGPGLIPANGLLTRRWELPHTPPQSMTLSGQAIVDLLRVHPRRLSK